MDSEVRRTVSSYLPLAFSQFLSFKLKVSLAKDISNERTRRCLKRAVPRMLVDEFTKFISQRQV